LQFIKHFIAPQGVLAHKQTAPQKSNTSEG